MRKSQLEDARRVLQRHGYVVVDARRSRRIGDEGAAGCLLLLAIIAAIYFGYRRHHSAQSASAAYVDQLSTLNRARDDLNRLKAFVDSQTNLLQSRQQILERLEKQEAALRPVVQADHKTVDAILAAESQRRQDNLWFDRAIAFVIGVASSMVAGWFAEHWRARALRTKATVVDDDGS